MIVRLLSTLALLWALGFALFATSLPGPAGPARTDGIVVLTGGPGRLRRGLDVLAAGQADRLLVSGVGRSVRKRDLARVQGIADALLGRIDLGAQAVDTRSNGDETARWVAAHRYRSIRLVTTDWHMPRARLELARALKGVKVVPDAVANEPALPTLVREYNKLLLRGAGLLAGQ